LLTILGFAIPAVYFFLQRMQLKMSEQRLERHFEAKFEQLKKDLQTNIAKSFESEQADARKSLRELELTTEATTQSIVALIGETQGHRGSALDTYRNALDSFIALSSDERIQKLLRYVKKHVLVKMSKDDFSPKTLDMEALTKSLKKVEERNPLLKADVSDFRDALLEAQNRQPKTA
jgi:hypothetical protein